jgi:hypothetical protein
LPFLIEDLTPRELRVPGGVAARHPNGATGVSRLEISAPDARRAVSPLSDLTDTTSDVDTPMRLGACVLSPVASEMGDVKGPGPSAVELAGTEPGVPRELDPVLAHGAGIRLRPTAG